MIDILSFDEEAELNIIITVTHDPKTMIKLKNILNDYYQDPKEGHHGWMQ